MASTAAAPSTAPPGLVDEVASCVLQSSCVNFNATGVDLDSGLHGSSTINSTTRGCGRSCLSRPSVTAPFGYGAKSRQGVERPGVTSVLLGEYSTHHSGWHCFVFEGYQLANRRVQERVAYWVSSSGCSWAALASGSNASLRGRGASDLRR